MVHNLVYNLCESLVTNIGGVAGIGKKTPPTPITYLTQWKIVGNSEVHTDPFLTSWKVSGNSVVDNNTILSCGDLGQDGKYHVKISNGVTIFDILLDEPLRKVNGVADTIAFPSSVGGKALVTRNYRRVVDMSTLSWSFSSATTRMYVMISDIKDSDDTSIGNLLCPIYPTISNRDSKQGIGGIAVQKSPLAICVYDANYITAASRTNFLSHVQGIPLIYQLATPATELIDVSPFPVSPTDAYTSANETPYSAFEYKKNVEIWSCGEYNAADGKYHILVQPLGGSIADIALDEPLRKVNGVADTIEFPSDTEGKALVTRPLSRLNLGNLDYVSVTTIAGGKYRYFGDANAYNLKQPSDADNLSNILCAYYPTITGMQVASGKKGIAIAATGNKRVSIFDPNFKDSDMSVELKQYLQGVELIYELTTPTTELIDAPQIQEAESYTCVISQGGKAVSWSSFETE